LGTYTEVTRTPSQVALIIRASASGGSPSAKPLSGSSMPTRLRMATPFQRPSP
jgi:hypothetical protein